MFAPSIGSVAFGWRRPTVRVFPPLIPLRNPNVLVLMLVIEDYGFLSFGTKLENPFAELLDINDVLIVQPIRYEFNEASFETQLTTICGGFMALKTDGPLMDVASKRLHVLGKF